MSDPMRPVNDLDTASEEAALRRPMRDAAEDPLAELARILGESTAHPVRPENVVELGRRVLPSKPAPQQITDLEAELFESLRSSVAPEERVRGDFPREMPPIIPQHAVDDHDIASLGAIAAPEDPMPTPVAREMSPDPRLADYYAYDDGISAGSYDPAFSGAAPEAVDLDAAFAAEIHRGRVGEPPRPTFDDFDTDAIAAAAREASPYVADDAVILPHSDREEFEAQRLPREGGRGGFRIAAVVVGVLLAGGGALAGWKVLGGKTLGGPVVIHADNEPMKVRPDPTRAPQPGDGEVSLKRDTKVDGSRIVSLQEDPVEHVSGRTADGREVRVINPGAQRTTNTDQPRAVKTVVVRPDGSIVSEDGAAAAPQGTPPAASPSAVPPGTAVPTPPPGSAAAPTRTVTTSPVTAVPPSATPSVPPVPTVPALPNAAAPEAPAMSASPAPVATPQAVAVPVPLPAPPRPVAAEPARTAAVDPVKPTAPAPIKAPTPVAPPKAVAQPKAPSTSGAPLALGPVAPRLATQTQEPPTSAPAPAAPAPAPVAAASASGDWAVQISASKSESDARRSLSDAQRRFSALAGKSGDVQRADLGAKGVYYRARFVAGSREAAAALCAQVQAQGGQCLVAHR